MITLQVLMGIIIVAVVYTFSKQLWEDIKADWLFNVEELSFCKHIWSRRRVQGFDMDEVICVGCGKKGAQS